MESYQYIQCEAIENVAYIYLDRRDKRNALNHQMRCELLAVLGALSQKVAVTVFASTSENFCAGVDLNEQIAGVDAAQEMWSVAEAIYKFPGVAVAAIRGAARGGGVTLVDACDLAIADDTASFGLPELGFGIYPSIAGPLTQLSISRKQAAWMVLMAEPISANQAEAAGLINQVVSVGELESRCAEIAERLSNYDVDAIQTAKQMLNALPVTMEQRALAVATGIDANVGLIQKLLMKEQ